MNITSLLKQRFQIALSELTDETESCFEMIRPSQEPKFGDYQANMAMSLGKKLGKPPREVAQMIVERIDVSDMCEMPEIAGPGFINLRLKNNWIKNVLAESKKHERLGVGRVEKPKTYVVDFSAPNVAKPMHVGHIRTTVIGNALARILRFYGHTVITDNHLGDWGTQFGMIIYGYRHFLNQEAYAADPVGELTRLYRLVRQLIDYHNNVKSLPQYEQNANELRQKLADVENKIAAGFDDKNDEKKAQKEKQRIETQIFTLLEDTQLLLEKIKAVLSDPYLVEQTQQHPDIAQAVLEETSKLHHGNEENRKLWNEILPACRSDIERIYQRLNISFDHTLGESFYNDMLPELVERLINQGIAQETEGAIGIFLPNQEIPLLIRKKDGAFLYATTDLATVEYRIKTFHPDVILYIVDLRQGLHFEQFFAAARLMGYTDVELKHVKFGTVMGEDGKPFKTRSGDTVGLEGLLDEAERRAYDIVKNNDTQNTLSEDQARETARRIGIGALVYTDLSQNRESDYVFSYDKMLAMNGNTGTYLQYAYARVQSIFVKGNVDIESFRNENIEIQLDEPAERALAVELLKFEEAIEIVLKDYRPNLLSTYLYELANRYSTFFEQCPVLKADNENLRKSRLLLSDLTARTLQKGLELLGIETVEKM